MKDDHFMKVKLKEIRKLILNFKENQNGVEMESKNEEIQEIGKEIKKLQRFSEWGLERTREGKEKEKRRRLEGE
jgi:hypothetical protein